MAENKKSFLLYADYESLFSELSDEEAGKLIKVVFKYVNDENPIVTDKMLNIAFIPIKLQLKRDLKRWDNKITKRAESGRLGGIKSGEIRALNSKQNEANEANASNSKQTKQSEANEAVTVTDTVTVNDTVTDTFINIKEREKENPSLFQIFLTENQIQNNDALEFLSSESWFESKAMQLKSETAIITEKAKDFLVNLRHRDKLEGKQLADFREHFVNWFKLNRSDTIPDKKYDYLIPKCLQ